MTSNISQANALLAYDPAADTSLRPMAGKFLRTTGVSEHP